MQRALSRSSHYCPSSLISGARYASKKAVGSTKNGRDSNAKYLGVKKFGGQFVKPGNIIVRQRGTRWHAGDNVCVGKDHTLHALSYGTVRFAMGKKRKNKMYVHVDPLEIEPEAMEVLQKAKV